MPSRLRIGVNALYLIPGGVGGTEIYLRNLLKALAEIDQRNEYYLYLNRETGLDLSPEAANFAAVQTGVKAKFRPGRLLWEQTGLARATSNDRLDVLFSPGFTSPRWSRGKRVTVIHDLQHRKQPENFGWLERRAWEWSVAQSVKRSDVVVTVSEASRKDVLDAYGPPQDKVRVIGHGVEPELMRLWEREEYSIDLLHAAGVPEGRFLLALSTVHPHKNWDRLLAAFKLLRERGADLRLVICGLPGKSWDDLRRKIDDEGLEGRVKVLGWQSRETVLALFRFAEALVFPSTFEGFGMPVLEAMAAGTPVVCSDIPPLRETAEGCATFFDPASAESIAEAVEKTLGNDDRRVHLVEQGVRRAESFTWRRAAEQTLELFLEIAKV